MHEAAMDSGTLSIKAQHKLYHKYVLKSREWVLFCKNKG